MLTHRDREVCRLRDELGRRVLLALACASSAAGFSAVAVLTPGPVEPWLFFVLLDIVVALACGAQAARMRRLIQELTYFS